MSNVLITLAVTFVIVVLAFFLLGISKFLTGKSRLRIGMCGKDPKKKKGEECGINLPCGICGKSEEKEEKKIDDKSSQKRSEKH